jgi:hypothetical protein
MYFQAKNILKNIFHHNTKHVSQHSTTYVHFVYRQPGSLKNALYIVSSLIKEFVSKILSCLIVENLERLIYNS